MKTDCFPNDIVSLISEPRFYYLMTNQLWSRPTWLIVTQMSKSRFVPIDRFTRSRPKHPADQFRSPADVINERLQFTGPVHASILWSSDDPTVDEVDTNVIMTNRIQHLEDSSQSTTQHQRHQTTNSFSPKRGKSVQTSDRTITQSIFNRHNQSPNLQQPSFDIADT